ncbi:hypothetical protein FRB91_006456, partial [Serendipita sp. 411]
MSKSMDHCPISVLNILRNQWHFDVISDQSAVDFRHGDEVRLGRLFLVSATTSEKSETKIIFLLTSWDGITVAV